MKILGFLPKTLPVLGSIAIVAGCTFIQPAIAESKNHETHFQVTFGGLEIGRAIFQISFDETTYSLTGSGKTSGLAEWFSSASGKVESSGQLIEDALKPRNHFVSVTEEKKTETLEMSFSDAGVDKVDLKTIKPRKPKLAPKYIPVEAEHLASVLDPASSMIIPMSGENAKDPIKVCNQNFPIYDGETRYDIKLRYKTTRPVKTKGYDGWAHVCKMKYVPVAGHKKNHRSVKEMAANEHMEIWLAPMGGVSVFTPIKILVGTKWGRFTASPSFFGLVDKN